MQAKEIQTAVAEYLVKNGHEAVCENFGHTVFEMDVAALSKSGMLQEYEIKISRSDFLCDKNKRRHWMLAKFDMYAMPSGHEFKCPNYFCYVCPAGLIKITEIPVYAGLWYCTDGVVSIIRKAKKIHKIPAEREIILKKMLRMTVQRKYLGCTMLTYQNRELARRWEETENYKKA